MKRVTVTPLGLLVLWLHHHGAKRTWLAQRLGVSPTRLSRLLSGTEPTMEERSQLDVITNGYVPLLGRWT